MSLPLELLAHLNISPHLLGKVVPVEGLAKGDKVLVYYSGRNKHSSFVGEFTEFADYGGEYLAFFHKGDTVGLPGLTQTGIFICFINTQTCGKKDGL